jgi:hypothetical protein
MGLTVAGRQSLRLCLCFAREAGASWLKPHSGRNRQMFFAEYAAVLSLCVPFTDANPAVNAEAKVGATIESLINEVLKISKEAVDAKPGN